MVYINKAYWLENKSFIEDVVFYREPATQTTKTISSLIADLIQNCASKDTKNQFLSMAVTQNIGYPELALFYELIKKLGIADKIQYITCYHAISKTKFYFDPRRGDLAGYCRCNTISNPVFLIHMIRLIIRAH